jgi:glycosyltransferase involved in cell wall biosynthesis
MKNQKELWDNFWNKIKKKRTDSKKSTLLRIGIIGSPFGTTKSELAGKKHLSNFIGILEPLSSEIHVVTGNFPEAEFADKQNIHVYNVIHEANYDPARKPLWYRFFRYVLLQMKISLSLVKISKFIDIAVFYTGSTALLLPILSAKLLRKKTIVAVAALASQIARAGYSSPVGRHIFPPVLKLQEKIIYFLSNQIIVESERTIKWLGLDKRKYRGKVSYRGELPIDTNLFRIRTHYNIRENIVGYVGRLSKEKGVIELIRAIPLILSYRGDIRFVIGGDGALFNEIKRELERDSLLDKVTLTGWIPDEQFPDYLNCLKLFILPSYTETGIPITILQAMACGTPVLATSVGGTSDAIEDGKTGFILEANSPASIAKNVIRALDEPRLDEIVKSAHDLIQREYTYDVVVENYRKLLMEKG